ncbi:MAG: hypothetical protein L0Z68_09410 [Gammaproteobacteria bacterium]|nr:hypothetical protein [Gammaproteobacteria bacterium]
MKKLRPLFAWVLCWSIAFQVLATTGGGACRHEPPAAQREHMQAAAPPHAGHQHHQADPSVQAEQTSCQCGCYCAGVCLHVCHGAGLTSAFNVSALPKSEPELMPATGLHLPEYYFPRYRPPAVS